MTQLRQKGFGSKLIPIGTKMRWDTQRDYKFMLIIPLLTAEFKAFPMVFQPIIILRKTDLMTVRSMVLFEVCSELKKRNRIKAKEITLTGVRP